MTSAKSGRDEELEALADELLGQGVGGNKRSVDRDVEKMSYGAGRRSADSLKFYDPTNDWDTQDSVSAVTVDPGDIANILPTITVDVDDGNIRAANTDLMDRQKLMRHAEDGGSGASAETIPLLGANEGPRKTCRRCKVPKGLALFSPKSDAKDGLHPWCKSCRKESVSQNRKRVP